MSNVRSIPLALAGSALALAVFINAATTSSAEFAASTENGQNLWEAATLSLVVEGDSNDNPNNPDDDPNSDGSNNASLFLNAAELYPGRVVTNCVVLSATSSLETIDVRLHGARQNDGQLGEYFDVVIERSGSNGDCSAFAPVEILYDGLLADLVDVHGTFGDGLRMDVEPNNAIELRFTGTVRDDNEAQGLTAQYLISLEARP